MVANLSFRYLLASYLSTYLLYCSTSLSEPLCLFSSIVLLFFIYLLSKELTQARSILLLRLWRSFKLYIFLRQGQPSRFSGTYTWDPRLEDANCIIVQQFQHLYLQYIYCITSIININRRFEMQKHTTLYIRQFFNNYLTNQHHTDTLNLLNSSLDVLDGFISQFALKHSISMPQAVGKNLSRNLSKQECFNATFGRLYENLALVFQWAESVYSLKQGKDDFDGFSESNEGKTSRSESMWKQTNDEQLYQILNEYKEANKKMKQTISGLNKKLESKNTEVMEIKLKKDIAEKQIGFLNMKVDQLEEEIKIMNETIKQKDNELRQRQQEIQQIRDQSENYSKEKLESSLNFAKLQEMVTNLQKQLEKTLKQKKQLEQRALQTSKQNRALINKKLDEIPSIIQSKLKSQDSWAMPAAQILKKFIQNREKLKQIAKAE